MTEQPQGDANLQSYEGYLQSTRSHPKHMKPGFVLGGYHHVFEYICRHVLLDPDFFSPITDQIQIEVFGPLHARLTATGVGLLPSWITLTSAESSPNLLWSFRKFAIDCVRPEADLDGTYRITNLIPVDLLIPYAHHSRIVISSEQRTFRQEFHSGSPTDAGKWTLRAPTDPAFQLDVVMESDWFDAAEFDAEKLRSLVVDLPIVVHG